MTGRLTAGWRRLQEADPFLLVARLTLLVALVNARGSIPLLLVAATATTVLALRPDLMRRPWPWLVFGAAQGLLQWLSWWELENHVIATTYWLVALGLSRLAHDRALVRQHSARLLIGLIFAFAFAWKLYSSQFISNEFFRYTLLWDERFEPMAELAGTDIGELAAAQRDLAQLTVSGDSGTVTFPEGEWNAELASLFTVWGLITEGAVALAYLLPVREDSYIRPVSVFVFCGTTYAVAPVVGFGLLLLTLVAATTSERQIRAAATVGGVVLMCWGFFFGTVLI